MKARDAYRFAKIKIIQIELERYNNHNGCYPTKLNDLITSTSSISTNDIRDPQSNVEYRYRMGFNDYELCFKIEEDEREYWSGVSCVTKDDFKGLK